MRKVFFVLVILCLLLTSCSTTRPKLFDLRQLINEIDASYAMTQAIKAAQDNATTHLYSYIENDESFIPSSYKELEDYKDIIPGLSTKLLEWKTYFSTFLLDNMETFVDKTDEYVSSLEFEDPISFVSSSTTSATEFYKSSHYHRTRSICLSVLNTADYSLLNQALNHYNSYILALNYFDNKNDNLLETIDYKQYFADLLISSYFDYLSYYEDIFRTTPSAYADERVVSVFGIY